MSSPLLEHSEGHSYPHDTVYHQMISNVNPSALTPFGTQPSSPASPINFSPYAREVPSKIPAQSIRCLRADWDVQTSLTLTLRRTLEVLNALVVQLATYSKQLDLDIVANLERLSTTRGRLGAAEMEVQRKKRILLEEKQGMLSKITHCAKDVLEELNSRNAETLTDSTQLILNSLVTQVRTLDFAAPDISTLTVLLRDDVIEEIRTLRSKVFDTSSVRITNRKTFPLKDLRIRCAVFDPDVSKNGLMYVGTEEGRVCCISMMDGSVVAEYRGHVYGITCIVISPFRSSKILITGSVDKTLRMIRVDKNGDLQCVFAEHRGHITGISCDSASGCIFTTSFDRQMLSWTFRHGVSEGVAFVAPSPIHSMIRSGSRIALGCRSGEVVLLTVENRKAFFEHFFAREPTAIEWTLMKESELMRYQSFLQQHRVTWGGHHNAVWCLAESQNFLFSGGDSGLIIQWDLTTKAKVRTYRNHVDRVSGIYVTREGLLVSSSYDATIVISNTVDGEVVAIERPHYHSITAICMGHLPLTADNSKPNFAMPDDIGIAGRKQASFTSSASNVTPVQQPEEPLEEWAGSMTMISICSEDLPQGPPPRPDPKPQFVTQLVSVSLDKSITILDITTMQVSVEQKGSGTP